jgi:uncharacterized repeat protein (TIGR01451 family)
MSLNMKYALVLAALAAPAALMAQSPQAVTLASKAFVVKQVPDGNGKMKNTLAAPERVLPGEALVFMLEYRNTAKTPASGFVINNPIPANVIYTGVEQPWATVSVDGGKSFGALAALKVAKPDGTLRAALPSDVTAVRWQFAQPIAPAASGRVMYFGMVK